MDPVSDAPPSPEALNKETLDSFIEASSARFHSTIGSLDSTNLIAPPAEIRFHYFKFDDDSRPRVSALAETLVDHLIQFCLSERRFQRHRSDLSLVDLQAANRDARTLLRRATSGGEAGEMLLYFFMEVLLRAPQVVSKMEIKGRSEMEVLGSDGIHLRWSEQDQVFDIFFGESKLEQTPSAAIRNAARSIGNFHTNKGREREIKLVTSQFKYLDEKGKSVASQIAKSYDTGRGLRTNHACLLGFTLKDYEIALKSKFREAELDFKNCYLAKVNSFGKQIRKHFSLLEWTRARFEIFVLPFPCVEAFRQEFDKVLNGK